MGGVTGRELLLLSGRELLLLSAPSLSGLAGRRSFGGVGVRRVESDQDVADYFVGSPGPAVLQRYHPGPFEAGVFYVREPEEEKGRIFSVTDKHFPVVTGDGCQTLEALIWRHPRFRMQAGVFLKRFAGRTEQVLEDGKRLRLARG